MADESPERPVSPVVDARTAAVLTALLAIDAVDATAVRDRTPSRRRPRTRYGPELDLGTDGTDGFAPDPR